MATNCNAINKTFDISAFSDLTSIKQKLLSMQKDINKCLQAADELDSRKHVYNNSIKVRKHMQKLKQKAQNVRGDCLHIKKLENFPLGGQKKTKWCPDPDYAFRCQCSNLGVKDSCMDQKDCALCSTD